VISSAVRVSVGASARSALRFQRVTGPAAVTAATGLPSSPRTGTPIA
jgi:hypothetical protein